MLDPAQSLSRAKIAFRLNGIAYTADLDTLVYRRQAKPSKERAIRRIGTADTLCIATMVQMIDAFKQGCTQQEQKLTKGLRDTVAVLGSHAERQAVWEYETEHGWVAHSAEIATALENGCKAHSAAAEPQQLSRVTYKIAGTTYLADFADMTQQRTGERFTAISTVPIRRVEVAVNSHSALASNATDANELHAVPTLIASQPLQWVAQPAAVVAPPPVPATLTPAAVTSAASAASAVGTSSSAVKAKSKKRKSSSS
eukprot:16812-Heterococcus_DN1.PRE.1